jgi:hypothetical protein
VILSLLPVLISFSPHQRTTSNLPVSLKNIKPIICDAEFSYFGPKEKYAKPIFGPKLQTTLLPLQMSQSFTALSVVRWRDRWQTHARATDDY